MLNNIPQTGPHGAGFSNMLFAPDNATIVEFGLKPQLNRAYGHLAASLGLDHWLVPQIAANHQDSYRIEDEHVALLIRLLRHILASKGMSKYIIDDKDEL